MKQSQNQETARAALREQIGQLAGQARLAASEPPDSPAVEELLAALAALSAEARAAGFEQAAVLAAAPVGDPPTADGVADTLARLDHVLSDAAQELLALAADAGMVRDFTVEARDHLATIEARLLELEQNPGDQDALHTIFRGFHTIKGLASFLDLHAIRDLAHEVETLLDQVRGGAVPVTPALIDVVLSGADYLRADLDRVLATLDGAMLEPADAGALLERVHALMAGGLENGPPQQPAPGDRAPGSESSVDQPAGDQQTDSVGRRAGRKSARAGTRRRRQAEAPPAQPPQASEPCLEDATRPEQEIKLPPIAEARAEAAPAHEAAQLTASTAPVEGAEAKRPAVSESNLIKVATDKLDFLVDMVGELVIAQSMVWHDGQLSALASPKLQRNLAQLSRITGEVQKTAMSMRMVPIRQLFQKSARLVRDLTRKTGKQVELELSGEETELDRTIVEELSDPLLHMIRNACDHGVETPEERQAAGKPVPARIQLRAFHQSGHIVVEIADDGRGMDRDQLVAKARSKGLISSETASMTDKEAFNLIFEPGFSTAERVTDISGRGVGMDVVRKQIQKLRGRVEIESEVGRGTTFLLKLPLTLAIIDGLVVGVGKERYIVPIFVVREIFRPRPETIFTVEERGVMVKVRGSLLPVIRLSERFSVEPLSQELAHSVVVVAEGSGKRFCLVVDELIGKQEVVIKSLGEAFKQVPGVAGGAILGDGRVGLIIDIDGIFGETHA